jgi:hypothetical protein
VAKIRLNLRHKLTGAQCELQNMPLTFSADGTRLLMGSEDGKGISLFTIPL